MERTANAIGEVAALGGGALTIREWPESERPREKLLKRGPHALSDAELLALLLGSGVPGCSAVAMARSLLKDFGCLRALLNARLSGWRRKGVGEARYAAVQAAVELAKRQLHEEMRTVSPLATPQATHRYLQAQLRDRPYEIFCCIYLDNRHRPIAFEELFRGTVDCAQVHPREVLRQALLHNATGIIVAHNHPSGALEPSPADDFITRRLKDLLALMDVRLIDHIIVGDTRCYSFAEHGLL
ncbi:MAG: DNA repair protein RadC [Gammaproteobacteria bacterium]|nr:DNA repair protein RadC [Gammaproteobacteria bacterium]MDE2262488.1 DNA repair protein RadC [Gammaproteobacteria bacterium]